MDLMERLEKTANEATVAPLEERYQAAVDDFNSYDQKPGLRSAVGLGSIAAGTAAGALLGRGRSLGAIGGGALGAGAGMVGGVAGQVPINAHLNATQPGRAESFGRLMDVSREVDEYGWDQMASELMERLEKTASEEEEKEKSGVGTGAKVGAGIMGALGAARGGKAAKNLVGGVVPTASGAIGGATTGAILGAAGGAAVGGAHDLATKKSKKDEEKTASDLLESLEKVAEQEYGVGREMGDYAGLGLGVGAGLGTATGVAGGRKATSMLADAVREYGDDIPLPDNVLNSVRGAGRAKFLAGAGIGGAATGGLAGTLVGGAYGLGAAGAKRLPGNAPNQERSHLAQDAAAGATGGSMLGAIAGSMGPGGSHPGRIIGGALSGAALGGGLGAGVGALRDRREEQTASEELIDSLEKTAAGAFGGLKNTIGKAFGKDFRNAKKTHNTTVGDFNKANTVEGFKANVKSANGDVSKVRQNLEGLENDVKTTGAAMTAAKATRDQARGQLAPAAVGIAGVGGVAAGSAAQKKKEEKTASEEFMNEMFKEAATAILSAETPEVKTYRDPMDGIKFDR